MRTYLAYALIVFCLSMLGLLAAATYGWPPSYALIIPPLAGACIAAFRSKGGNDEQ